MAALHVQLYHPLWHKPVRRSSRAGWTSWVSFSLWSFPFVCWTSVPTLNLQEFQMFTWAFIVWGVHLPSEPQHLVSSSYSACDDELSETTAVPKRSSVSVSPDYYTHKKLLFCRYLKNSFLNMNLITDTWRWHVDAWPSLSSSMLQTELTTCHQTYSSFIHCISSGARVAASRTVKAQSGSLL